MEREFEPIHPPTQPEAKSEAGWFLRYLENEVKKGKPLQGVLKRIRENDVGQDSAHREEVLRHFNALFETERGRLEKIEKRSPIPPEKKPLPAAKTIVDPLRARHEEPLG